MTDLQLHDDVPHPELHRASERIGKVLMPVFGIGIALVIPIWLGWIEAPTWTASAARGALTLCALAEALKHLSKIRPDSPTRRMKGVIAVLLPLTAAFLDPDHFPADAALVAFAALGVAYTADTQTGLRAWSRDRWVAAAGSVGFVVFLAGVIGPGAPNWFVIVASWFLLVMALYAGLGLYEVDMARDEDGAPDGDPAALTGAAPREGA